MLVATRCSEVMPFPVAAAGHRGHTLRVKCYKRRCPLSSLAHFQKDTMPPAHLKVSLSPSTPCIR